MLKTLIKTILLGAFIFSILETSAQDKLLLLNGKELKGQLVKKTDDFLTLKTSKNKEYLIDSYRLFSYTQNNKENILYKYDTLSGNYLTAADMKLFVYGERDAHKTYNSNFVNILGLAVGGTAGYFMHKDERFILIPTPLVYTIFTLPFGSRVKHRKIEDKQYFKEDEYLRGHARIAKSKKTQNALKTSALGMGIGFLISVIAN